MAFKKFKYLMEDHNRLYLTEKEEKNNNTTKKQNGQAKSKSSNKNKNTTKTSNTPDQGLQRSAGGPGQVPQGPNQTTLNPAQVGMTPYGYAQATGQAPRSTPIDPSNPTPNRNAVVQGATGDVNSRFGNNAGQQPSFWQQAQAKAQGLYNTGKEYATNAYNQAGEYYNQNKDAVNKGLMYGGAAAAGAAGMGVAMRWASNRKEMRKILGDHRTKMFECETYNDPDQKKACREQLNQMTHQKLDSIQKMCAQTENPKKCEQEVKQVKESL